MKAWQITFSCFLLDLIYMSCTKSLLTQSWDWVGCQLLKVAILSNSDFVFQSQDWKTKSRFRISDDPLSCCKILSSKVAIQSHDFRSKKQRVQFQSTYLKYWRNLTDFRKIFVFFMSFWSEIKQNLTTVYILLRVNIN